MPRVPMGCPCLHEVGRPDSHRLLRGIGFLHCQSLTGFIEAGRVDAGRTIIKGHDHIRPEVVLNLHRTFRAEVDPGPIDD